MNTLLIIYVAISVILGIARTIKLYRDTRKIAKWYQYLWAMPLAFTTEALGWPIIGIAMLVYHLWIKIVS